MTNEHTTNNNNKTDLTLARAIYIGVWAATIVIAILYECHFLTEGYIKADAETEYALNMLCVLFTLGGTWGSLKLFATKHVRTALHNQPSKLPQWNMSRTGILACCIFINLIVYYGLMSGTSALFCLLISLTGFVFCWPKQGETD